MRQRHFAGEKLFVDYAGQTVPIDGRSGEESFRAQLFVSALRYWRTCVGPQTVSMFPGCFPDRRTEVYSLVL